MDLSVPCSLRAASIPAPHNLARGGLLVRDVPLVRFRTREKWRCRGLLVRRQQLYGCSNAPAQQWRRLILVSASSQSSAEVDERTGLIVEIGRSLEEFAEGGGADKQQGRSLVHAVHESARVFLVGLQKQKTLASKPWFPLKWPGVDKNAWIKALSYQVRAILKFELVFSI